ncbi:MAG: hypothetical protein H6815_04405 [Phycisphaeraceae bacterium]|nr:hypothetical protein [Phycisphaerales bacterium]MCB9859674.1 hypothetical protein [Phycisphaeraceae bacterium]
MHLTLCDTTTWTVGITGALFLVLAGAALIVRCLFAPVSIKRAPTCGGCGYELSDVSAGVCPECGGSFLRCGVVTPRGVVRMRGSAWMIVVGWTLIVCAIAGPGIGYIRMLDLQAKAAAAPVTPIPATANPYASLLPLLDPRSPSLYLPSTPDPADPNVAELDNMPLYRGDTTNNTDSLLQLLYQREFRLQPNLSTVPPAAPAAPVTPLLSYQRELIGSIAGSLGLYIIGLCMLLYWRGRVVGAA